jgi:hypothetical protein
MRSAVLLMLCAAGSLAEDGYLGSRACFGCHSSIYRSFSKTAMANSMRPAENLPPPALPSETTIPLAGSLRMVRVWHDDGGWWQSETEPGVFETKHQLAYAVGSGVNGITFLVRRGDYLFQAPLSFYTRTAKWELSPGYEHADLGFSRIVPQECTGCHAGRANLNPNRPAEYRDPPFAELAIGCENCHGPGEAHVKSGGKKLGTIVNPLKLPPRLAENICVNCHQTGDARVLQTGKKYQDFRPGQWLFDTAVILKIPGPKHQGDLLEHYTAMQASRCFRESAGKLSCLSCHDPHVEPAKTEAPGYFRAKCLNCHTEQNCKVPLKVRSSRTPVDDCAGCHMPKRAAVQISHSALTNHRIPARDGETAPDAAAVGVDGMIVVDPPGGKAAQLSDVVLLEAFRDLSYRDESYQQRYTRTLEKLEQSGSADAFVQAALGHKAVAENRFEDALPNLKKALPLSEAAVYLDLDAALTKLKRPDEAIEYLKKGVEIDPYNPLLRKTLISRYINARRYDDARQDMRSYVELFPEDSFMRGLLDRVR